MWFLRVDTLALIALMGIIMAVIVKLPGSGVVNKKSRWDKTSRWDKKSSLRGVCLLVLNSGLLFYIDRRLFFLYVIYVALSWLILETLVLALAIVCRDDNAKKKKRRCLCLFLFGIFLCLIPFLISRFWTTSIIISIGMAFNMLKAIDALFFVYYTEMKIPFLTYANFILFIPTFTAGPIFRYRDFAKNFANPKPVNSKDLEYIFSRIVKGLFKKVVLAELVIIIFKHLQTLPLNPAVAFAVIAASYFTLYFDLSGYSDIAVGFGRLCGYSVPENFKNPFTAASFTAFWRNWHVSLSDWIREHVFIIVMNKRLNKLQSAAIGFFTMFIMSLWHGFNLPYVIAGSYNGAFLAIENLLSLTSVNKMKRGFVFYLRCFAVNFLFGINTIVFTTDWHTALRIVKALIGITV